MCVKVKNLLKVKLIIKVKLDNSLIIYTPNFFPYFSRFKSPSRITNAKKEKKRGGGDLTYSMYPKIRDF